MTQVVPAIIPQNFDHLRGQVVQVKDFVRRVQVDIIDGEYAPNPTWPYKEDNGRFAQLVAQKEGLPFWREVTYEFDLMVENPGDIVSDYIQMGASGIIVHNRSTDSLFEILDEIKKAHMETGVALVPQDFAGSVDVVELAENADFIQIMGNDNIGHHGVSLDPDVYGFVKKIRDINDEIDIAVDIGVNHQTAPELIAAGVTKLVSGSAIFGAEDIELSIDELAES